MMPGMQPAGGPPVGGNASAGRVSVRRRIRRRLAVGEHGGRTSAGHAADRRAGRACSVRSVLAAERDAVVDRHAHARAQGGGPAAAGSAAAVAATASVAIAAGGAASLEASCAQLQHDVDSLALFARTLLTMLEESKVVTRAQFDETKNRLDMLDGKLDDR